MLDKIPAEITSEIFSYLLTPDLLQCMLVCRSLTSLAQSVMVNNVSLYFTSNIYAGLDFFRVNYLMAQQVHYADLRIERDFRDLKLLQMIPSILPNLHSLRLYSRLQYYDISGITVTSKCQRTLKEISMHGYGAAYAVKMLQETTFRALQSIRVSFHNSHANPSTLHRLRSMHEPDVNKMFIKCLKNAPNLKQLDIKNATLYVCDVEDMHNYAPGLQELTVATKGVPFAEQKLTIGSHIKPLIKLKTLNLAIVLNDHEVDELNENVIKWLEYVHHKYIGLTNLRLEIMDPHESEIHLDRFGFSKTLQSMNMMKRIVQKLENMERIESQFFPFTRENVALCNGFQLQAAKLWDMHVSIEQQLKNLHASKQADTIKALHLVLSKDDHYTRPNAFKRLLADYKMKHLRRLDIKIELEQHMSLPYALPVYILRYVPALESFSLDYMEINDEVLSLFKVQSGLKHFEVNLFRARGNLEATNAFFENLFKACPLLESFDVRFSLKVADTFTCLILDLKKYTKHLKNIHLRYDEDSTCLLFNDDPKRRGKFWETHTRQVREPFTIEKLIDLRCHDDARLKIQAYDHLE
ncbi:uncharacterized protein ATC70_005592 [Mucor velutinosus]|uniref:F-box domain-containing protein n=1 Tax=Mucor velutinosus TaxID=708070 RepID=A0AAN7DA51_9FUNG|nr:hypothetical protein ATC70_005592 [Mucor velutinosus]